jgi:uncharacterized OsmC-like protein
LSWPILDGVTDNLRTVQIIRTGPRTYEAVNARGGRISLGEGQNSDFTPVELLLAAMAGCSAIDVDYITSRRAEPSSFEATAAAPKLADDKGNHLGEVVIDFRVAFPDGADGDRAHAMLDRAVRQSRDRLCTVSRTVQLSTPVSYQVDGAEV